MLEYFNFRSTTAEARSRFSRFWRLYIRPLFDLALTILGACTVVAVILMIVAVATQWQVDPANVHVMTCKVEASQPGHRLVRPEGGPLTMLSLTPLIRHPKTDAQKQMLSMLMHPGAVLRVSYVQDSNGDKYVLKAVEAE